MNAIDGWTKTLPGHWVTKPLKAVASYIVSNVDKIPSDDEQPVRLCNYTDVYNNEFISSDMNLMQTTATATEIEKFRLLKNDVVITKDSESWDDIAIPSLIVDTADDLLCGYHLAILRPKLEELNGRFLFRCLQSKSIRLQLELASTGVTRFGLPKGEIGKMLLPLASMEEQLVIAKYLDIETTQIDALINEKQHMLALLAEKRDALISQAVTRGLNPDAPLRPSDIPWLGDIPAHWKERKLKYIAWLKSGEFITSESITETGEYPVFGGNGLRGNTSSYTHIGDHVLIGRQGALCGNIHYASGHFWASEHAVVAHIIGETEVYWLGEILHIMNLNRYSESAAQPGISVSVIGNLKIPVPPLNEQKVIASEIKKEREKSAEIETALTKSISLLKERRSVLITAAVTGQIEIEV